MKEKCFADRKDGSCHALIKKECKRCKFYYPRNLLKDNPFYEYSYEDIGKMKHMKKEKIIRKDQIMTKDM